METKQRLVYCHHDDCRTGQLISRGLPPVCPTCERATMWMLAVPEAPSATPAVPWSPSKEDQKFLKALRIGGDAD